MEISPPRSRASCRRSIPSTNSIEMKRTPPSSPYSWIRQTLRWETLRASLISWRNRWAISGVLANSARRTLIATASSSMRSWALYTMPMPALAERAQDLVAIGDERALGERTEGAPAGEAGLGVVVVDGLGRRDKS